MLKNKPINARSGFMTEVTAMKSDPTERCDVISEPQSGMTLLEYYAGNAPDMPDWFIGTPQALPVCPNMTDYPESARDEIRSWLYDPVFDLSENCGTFQADFEEWRKERDKIEKENVVAQFFQWRIFYAKALIAELEKEQ